MRIFSRYSWAFSSFPSAIISTQHDGMFGPCGKICSTVQMKSPSSSRSQRSVSFSRVWFSSSMRRGSTVSHQRCPSKYSRKFLFEHVIRPQRGPSSGVPPARSPSASRSGLFLIPSMTSINIRARSRVGGTSVRFPKRSTVPGTRISRSDSLLAVPPSGTAAGYMPGPPMRSRSSNCFASLAGTPSLRGMISRLYSLSLLEQILEDPSASPFDQLHRKCG